MESIDSKEDTILTIKKIMFSFTLRRSLARFVSFNFAFVVVVVASLKFDKDRSEKIQVEY